LVEAFAQTHMTVTTTAGECPSVVLSDDPSNVDAFGIYDRLVAAIAATVVKDKGGKAIGLVGSWGSGKSTVIQLLEARLAKTDVCLWQFDAWAHEGDPLRRTF
jgi:ABC-type transport system involved in cytochrome bd biosynthesis fused ATPase/permease subunit